jgi:hypothetical protein
MKKHFIILTFLFLLIIPVSAQRPKDALYLKNGSIIYGKLLEISDNKYRIQTSDGSLFNYSSDEVDRFIKEVPGYNGRKTSGPGFALEGGLLIGSQASEPNAPFSFNIILNYTVSSKSIFGIGSGVEFLGSSFAPIFLEYKRLLNEKKVAPFILFRGGALIHTGSNDNDESSYPYYYPKNYRGGSTFLIGTGISWAREDIESYLSFGYRYAQTSYRQGNYNDVIYTYKNNYNRLEIKFGFKF